MSSGKPIRRWTENDLAYQRGRRSAFMRVLGDIASEFGWAEDLLSSEEKLTLELARRTSERAEAIDALRDVCGEVGDNDWDEKLHLADIIEKHLARYIDDGGTEKDDGT